MFRPTDADAEVDGESTARVPHTDLIGAIPPAPGRAVPMVADEAAPPTGPPMPTVGAAPPAGAPAITPPVVAPVLSIPAFVPTFPGSPPRTPLPTVAPQRAAASQAASVWQLTLADGQTIPVTGSLVLGRDPAPVTRRAATMVSVIDPARSVSKSHALVELVDGELWVTDLHSTNGVTVSDVHGARTPVTPGVRTAMGAGVSLSLGEFAVQVSRPDA
ncbi:hypothetical protein C3B59_15610 [Cryobacterium zongtaii]|uniref:FHA domain-containing protein n=2 Tax=Microbacteriaceae TaxID=85023 RepID=A0A2S3Z8V2_9MICO|nr:hypothetical protein C3B59_15610 [Cryobacterium zongtaii]